MLGFFLRQNETGSILSGLWLLTFSRGWLLLRLGVTSKLKLEKICDSAVLMLKRFKLQSPTIYLPAQSLISVQRLAENSCPVQRCSAESMTGIDQQFPSLQL